MTDLQVCHHGTLRAEIFSEPFGLDGNDAGEELAVIDVVVTGAADFEERLDGRADGIVQRSSLRLYFI